MTAVPGVVSAALELYDAALSDGSPLRIHSARGQGALALDHWRGEADADDETLLARCVGPTVDLGSGPGRLVGELTRRGVPSLGVDVSPAAVRLGRARGGMVLRRSLFARLPGEGRWARVLLADGNIGIGGDLDLLLGRVAQVLAPEGHALLEVSGEDVDEVRELVISAPDGRRSDAFPWAFAGARAAAVRGRRAGLLPDEAWVSGARHFLALRRSP